jgi:hypothetical protein
MRENAVQMDKLVAATRTRPPQSLSAVEDLKTYEEFGQAHVDGLRHDAGCPEEGRDKVFDTSERGANTTVPGKQG